MFIFLLFVKFNERQEDLIFIGLRAPTGVSPLPFQLPISWLGHRAPIIREDGCGKGSCLKNNHQKGGSK